MIGEALAGAGASVTVSARQADGARQAADEIASKTGRKTLGIAADVSNADQVEEMVACDRNVGASISWSTMRGSISETRSSSSVRPTGIP